MDVREIGWEGMDWIHLAQDRDQRWALANRIMSEPSGSIKCREFLDYLSDYMLFKDSSPWSQSVSC